MVLTIRGASAQLILIRHGESVANLEQRFTHSDDEPLTVRGIEQARATGQRLQAICSPVALYSSPLRRALETARQIGELLGLAPEPIEQLYEQHFGELRGQPYTAYYDIHAPRPAGVERWDRRPPGGETLRDVVQRAGPVLDELARRHVGQEIVVVCHGGVMAALRAHARGHFEHPPESTSNAGGYRLRARIADPAVLYEGPYDLFG